jgi:hypothetical protein
MTKPNPLEVPDDWNETSAPWPFDEDDILDEDEDIELPEE